MPAPLTLALKSDELDALEILRRTDPRPYVRERAAAILKIGQAQSGRAVALHGLLKPRQPDTVYAWVSRFRAQGVAGLFIRPGRGRKPAFSPAAHLRRRRTQRTAPSRPTRPTRTGSAP